MSRGFLSPPAPRPGVEAVLSPVHVMTGVRGGQLRPRLNSKRCCVFISTGLLGLLAFSEREAGVAVRYARDTPARARPRVSVRKPRRDSALRNMP